MKRVLIISYYWPPAGGVGVLRCLKFSKYLRKFGWEPVIYAPLNANYLFYDYSNVKDISDDTEILQYPIREPFRLYKKLSGRKEDDPSDPVHFREKISFLDNLAIWIRGNFFIPDARCFWINPSVKYLKAYLKTRPVDAILTDGPPHTNTMIGQKLSSSLGIPWLADFQDPWSQADYYRLYKISRWADKRHRKMEQSVFRTANKITMASPSWAKDLEKIGARDIDVLYFGYDEDDFIDLTTQLDSDFTITHAGQLSIDRNPKVFLKVLRDLKHELPGFRENLKLNFIGHIDLSIKKSLTAYGLMQHLNSNGPVDHEKAVQISLNSQLLLLVLNRSHNANGRIPGKFYEYLRAGRPILCLGPNHSDVAEIMKDCQAGVCIDHDNYEEIKSFIANRYNLYLKNENTMETQRHKMYSNENQTRILSGYLNQISNTNV